MLSGGFWLILLDCLQSYHEDDLPLASREISDDIMPYVTTSRTRLLGLAANRNFYEVKYIRLPDLLVEITMARVSNTYQDLMKRYKKVSLLILDEWLLYSLKKTEVRDLLELVEARNKASPALSLM